MTTTIYVLIGIAMIIATILLDPLFFEWLASEEEKREMQLIAVLRADGAPTMKRRIALRRNSASGNLLYTGAAMMTMSIVVFLTSDRIDSGLSIVGTELLLASAILHCVKFEDWVKEDIPKGKVV